MPISVLRYIASHRDRRFTTKIPTSAWPHLRQPIIRIELR
jgi:hypothetical protein